MLLYTARQWSFSSITDIKNSLMLNLSAQNAKRPLWIPNHLLTMTVKKHGRTMILVDSADSADDEEDVVSENGNENENKPL